ncbi:substrate-binding domain-containing protein [Clostridium butyricum]|uniref:substrate-binding domain-containing protein n=1 Tax=Clostridium butyricum TaxID=1492 RepID=UPI0002CB5DBF|nr:helix-turn-helix transcriptional regulator [Clostridium butyricum]EMU52699.1 DNA binding domain, excisionase family [Clostridium butyricum DKU-01]MDU6038844.1 helix-turn-helix transcriptional regulator [Clostridium butyricum]MZI80174.1 excisionase family DNA-binding protein [Clostridium butyricum]
MKTDKKLLSPLEVAEILSISKKTVYEIIKRNELKAFKVGNKFRIDQDEVERYIGKKDDSQIDNHLKEKQSRETVLEEKNILNKIYRNYIDNKIVICGQDVILDILAKYMNRYKDEGKVLRLYDNSFNGLCALYNDDVHVTASHIWNCDLDEYNADFASRVLIGTPITVVTLCHRIQGFYVLKGNPKMITGWASLAKRKARIINRELGSGSRILLDQSIRKYNIDKNMIIGYSDYVNSAGEVVNRIRMGQADVGIGLKCDINCPEKVDFIPLHEERYDLIFKSENLEKPQFKRLLKILSMNEFKDECVSIRNYDYSEMGNIVKKFQK